VRPLNDGNERMVVVEIDCLPRPICLINCYMPTFGYPDTSEKFQDNLDLLEAIPCWYVGESPIMADVINLFL
jgi:hypothetical protein